VQILKFSKKINHVISWRSGVVSLPQILIKDNPMMDLKKKVILQRFFKNIKFIYYEYLVA